MKTRLKYIFNAIDQSGSKFVYSPAIRNVALRLVAVLMIFTLLIPTGYVGGGVQKASASSSLIIPQAAPISAPPEAFFSIEGGNAGRGECVSSSGIIDPCGIGTRAAAWVSAFFGASRLPEGFGSVRAPLFSEKVVSSLASVLGVSADFGFRVNPPAYAGGSDQYAPATAAPPTAGGKRDV